MEKDQGPLWKNKDFLLLWWGQAISTFGSKASGIIFPLLILDLTHSPFLAGLIAAVTTIPYILLSLFIGAFIDKTDRKKVMILCDIGRTLALAILIAALILGKISVVLVYFVALIEGVCFVFFDIAEIASQVRVAGKDNLSNAMAKNQTTDGIAALLGPSMGATIYQTVGKFAPFLLDAFSYFVSVLTLLFIKTDFQEERSNKKFELKKNLIEGVSWVWNNKILRFMAIQATLGTLAFVQLFLILIVLARQLHSSTTQIGLIISIGSIGTIIGALMGNKITKKFHATEILTALSWVIAFIWLCYLFAQNFLMIGIITAVLFIFDSIWAITMMSYRLTLIPDELQGRVNSSYRFIIYLSAPIGAGLTGFLLQTYGARPTILIFFFILVFVAIITSLNKDFREEKRRIQNSI